MTLTLRRLSTLLLFLAGPTAALAQGLPATQPNLLQIYREEVKVGRGADHRKLEAGWPAAFEKAKSKYYYLALESMTGAPEVWFVTPLTSHADLGDMLKEEYSEILGPELERLSKADAEVLSGARSFQVIARKDLSHGAFPDTAKQRFFEVTTFRVRPGHEPGFEAVAKAYGAATDRAGRDTSYRVYEVIAGMPSPTYLVFASVQNVSEFDQMMSGSEATMKAFTPDERQSFGKFMMEGLVSSETQRYRLSPEMSYVPKETRASDPAFWMPKKPAAKTPPSPQKPPSQQ